MLLSSREIWHRSRCDEHLKFKTLCNLAHHLLAHEKDAPLLFARAPLKAELDASLDERMLYTQNLFWYHEPYSMNETHKITKQSFAGSLARRVILVCLTLLIAPLFINSFFLYWREIQIEEREVVDFLKAFGVQKAADLERLIQMEWGLLSVETPALAKKFQVQKVPLPQGVSEPFAVLNDRQSALLVGIKADASTAYAIAHPLEKLLVLENAPFPIDVAFAPHAPHADEWVESFPVAGTDLVLTLGTSRSRIRELQQSLILLRVGSFIVLIGIIGGGLVYWLTRKLAKPLRALCQTMIRVADGAIHSRFEQRAFGFEINGIGQLFNETMDALLTQQQIAESEKIQRERLSSELRLGHDIQKSLLPDAIALSEGHEVATGYLPATEVGGDFCDAFLLEESRLLIALGDVAGKGVSACLFSLGLRSSLRALAATTTDLGALVEKVNDLFLLDVKESGLFATLWLGMIEKNTLRYINLGHPPALLKRDRTLRELAGGNPALGVMPLKGLKSHSVELKAGDELLLYSDGITEAHNMQGKLYGLERLKAAYLNTPDSSADATRHLIQGAQTFSQGAQQHDDMTLVFVKW